eukprot:5194594-Amphidinium_carterae.1
MKSFESAVSTAVVDEVADNKSVYETGKHTLEHHHDGDSGAVIPSMPLRRSTKRQQRKRPKNICWAIWVYFVLFGSSVQLVSALMDVPVPQLILQSVQIGHPSYDQYANLPIPSTLSHGEQNRENLVEQIVDMPVRQTFAAAVQAPVFTSQASSVSWANI